MKMSKNTFPEYIMEMLRQRRRLKKDDTSEDALINQYSSTGAFKECVGWKIGDGWADEILGWMESCGFSDEHIKTFVVKISPSKKWDISIDSKLLKGLLNEKFSVIMGSQDDIVVSELE
jgi:hypothetical protein